MKRIIQEAAKLGIFAFLLMGVFLLVTSKTNRLFGIQSFVVLTGSMQPAIKQGSITLTRPQQNYTTGDIIAYRQGDVTVTHRIMKVTSQNGQTHFQTKGDANNNHDSALVSKNDVLGKNVLTIPFIGTFALFIRTLPGFLAFVIVPGVIFIAWEIRNIFAAFKKDIEQKVLETKGI